ncbi:hypothetical protein, variant 2 [Aphanomyces invadans]|uniref:F-box domain-containing protein n=1 Tax=Aphanomyces invadans TaxID=157072 RepID=A0A024TQ75_9STRA|nr:hypothetical protein, variant 2 [Aphanomyces invadans]ETV95776.1 hypothetical protein, variant 2 [Aphanomyces invadans]|eukprot:XP_008875525.1 hypothetical protein, variant 2 [Aphanomyces invadans]
MPRPVLSEELEKMVLAFVQPLPHFVTWQLVSRRWRTILSSLPAYDANMDCIRPVDSALYLALLQRWPMLRSVTMTHDVHVSNEMTWQLGLAQLAHLEHLSLRRTFTKVLQELFKSCPAIRSLSVLAGSDLRLPTVKTSLMHLQKLELQAATLANNSSIMSIVRNAPQLTHFVVSAASDVTSQVLTQLATSCPHIQQVVLNQCGLMVASQVDTFLRKFHAQLTWVDLSHCHDLKLFLMVWRWRRRFYCAGHDDVLGRTLTKSSSLTSSKFSLSTAPSYETACCSRFDAPSSKSFRYRTAGASRTRALSRLWLTMSTPH